MANEKELTPMELKQQADALLAGAEASEKAAAHRPAAKSGKKKAEEAPPHVLTDEEAKKAGILRLDDKQVAALPAPAGSPAMKNCGNCWPGQRSGASWTPES